MLVLIIAVAAISSAAPSAPVGRSAANSSFMKYNYPRKALERGEQGKVAFEVAVEADGFLRSCKIVQSSGFATLDRGTCEFLVAHAKFPVTKTAEGQPVGAIHQGSINWRLPDPSRTPAVARPMASTASLELICKRFRKSGTKVAYVRQCLTESEWAVQSDRVQDDLRRLQGVSGTIPSGPMCAPRC